MTDAVPQTGSTVISTSLHMDDERDDRFTAATTSTVSSTSNELTMSIMPSSAPTSPSISSPTSTSISSPLSVPTQFTEINISPPTTDDRMIFNDIDISDRFHSFQQDINNHLQQDIAITVEEHVQHLLALSSILLLKPALTHKDLHKYIDLNTCDALCQHIIEKHKMTKSVVSI